MTIGTTPDTNGILGIHAFYYSVDNPICSPGNLAVCTGLAVQTAQPNVPGCSSQNMLPCQYPSAPFTITGIGVQPDHLLRHRLLAGA